MLSKELLQQKEWSLKKDSFLLPVFFSLWDIKTEIEIGKIQVGESDNHQQQHQEHWKNKHNKGGLFPRHVVDGDNRQPMKHQAIEKQGPNKPNEPPNCCAC